MLPEMSRSMLRNALILGLFAVATVGLVAVTRQGTVERIQVAEREAQIRALAQVLPAGSYNNHLLDNELQLSDPLLGDRALPAYLALKDGQPSAIILQAIAPDGYSGSIHLLVGVRTDGRLAGVRVLAHKETPGLGDKIELVKSPWVLAFADKSLQDPDEAHWGVKKDQGVFDQFAGATVTPRAVVKAVHRALQYFDAHKTELFAQATASAPAGERAQ